MRARKRIRLTNFRRINSRYSTMQKPSSGFRVLCAPGRPQLSSTTLLLKACLLLLAIWACPRLAYSQHATIDDAWWTFQQDCNGDGCVAGLLSGDQARLN